MEAVATTAWRSRPPEPAREPVPGPGDWVRRNLFRSRVGNGIVTIVAAPIVGYVVFRLSAGSSWCRSPGLARATLPCSWSARSPAELWRISVSLCAFIAWYGGVVAGVVPRTQVAAGPRAPPPPVSLPPAHRPTSPCGGARCCWASPCCCRYYLGWTVGAVVLGIIVCAVLLPAFCRRAAVRLTDGPGRRSGATSLWSPRPVAGVLCTGAGRHHAQRRPRRPDIGDRRSRWACCSPSVARPGAATESTSGGIVVGTRCAPADHVAPGFDPGEWVSWLLVVLIVLGSAGFNVGRHSTLPLVL